MSLKVAQYIIAQLKAWGVKRIYGVVGSEIIPLVAAISREKELQFIAVRHESAAGFMASTEAKLTGELGVCLTTAGPGLANLLNGIADAAQDHVPVLVLSGQIATKQIGTHFKQYLNQQLLISPLALFSEMITHPDVTSSLLIQAMQKALIHRGVCHLTLPIDIQEMSIEKTIQIAPAPTDILQLDWQLNEKVMEAVVQEIKTAQKPVVLIGGGTIKAAKSVNTLVEKIGAPLITSLGAKGIIAGEHPQHMGGIGDGGSIESIEILKEADLLIIIGCTWYPTSYMPDQLPIIHIDHNPDNIGLNRNLIASLIGKAESILPKLIDSIPNGMNSEWRTRTKEAHERYITRITAETAIIPNQTPIHPIHLIGEIEKVLSDDTIIILDTGEHTILFNRYFKGSNQKILFSGKWRSMGYALPSANTAQLLFPNKKVVAIIGDGSFLMNVGELSTSVRYQLPIIVMIMNNYSLLLEERKSWQKGYTPSDTELTNPDFARLAQSFGWHGFTLNNEGEINETLRKALQLKAPVLIDAHLNHSLLTNIKP